MSLWVGRYAGSFTLEGFSLFVFAHRARDALLAAALRCVTIEFQS